MTDSLFIFTFSPVQSFIAESRRADDLFTSSHILVKLAKAAAQAIQTSGGRLIYPADPTVGDIPNRIVAIIPTYQVKTIARSAEVALKTCWSNIANAAKISLTKLTRSDHIWNSIWDRQVDHFWEIYWAAVPKTTTGYRNDMALVHAALDGVKRTRQFEAVEEDGPKDTLSGKRAALHTASTSPTQYWTNIASRIRNSRLRPNGRERLDAIGAIKRFWGDNTFPSTSTVASLPFLEAVRKDPDALQKLRGYRDSIQTIGCFTVCEDPDWPFDGDLLFLDTLTEKRLQEDYFITSISPDQFINTRDRLKELYQHMKQSPSPYYALILMDGDNMGAKVVAYNDENESVGLSRDLSSFAQFVQGYQSRTATYARVIYNGGDDLMALVPLPYCLGFSRMMADNFNSSTGGTMSAGIAIGHHQYPLRAVIQAARDAERNAKQVADNQKNAVCVMALKRSGETRMACSHWKDLDWVSPTDIPSPHLNRMDAVIEYLRSNRLSTNFAYTLEEESRVGTALSDPAAQESLLKRLIKRHKTSALSDSDEDSLRINLMDWVKGLNQTSNPINSIPQGFAELGIWMVIARFIAEGDKE